MNNEDTISRSALMERLMRKKCGPANVKYTAGWNDCIMRVRSMVHSAATVPPQVEHGHPVHHNRPARYEHYEMVQQTEDGEPLYKRQSYMLQDNPVEYCPKCGKRLCSRFTNYCPNCGAKMDGGKDDAAD